MTCIVLIAILAIPLLLGGRREGHLYLHGVDGAHALDALRVVAAQQVPVRS